MIASQRRDWSHVKPCQAEWPVNGWLIFNGDTVGRPRVQWVRWVQWGWISLQDKVILRWNGSSRVTQWWCNAPLGMCHGPFKQWFSWFSWFSWSGKETNHGWRHFCSWHMLTHFEGCLVLIIWQLKMGWTVPHLALWMPRTSVSITTKFTQAELGDAMRWIPFSIWLYYADTLYECNSLHCCFYLNHF